MRLPLSYLIVIAALISCKKDKLDINSFWECNNSLSPDSAAISNKLAGSWTWFKQSCGDYGEFKNANKDIQVTFNSDYSFAVTEAANTLSQGTWKLKQIDGGFWGLDLSSTSEYLNGRVLFCDNQLLLNDSYRDACDNLFEKK